jgi:GTPase SAR1 family protein
MKKQIMDLRDRIFNYQVVVIRQSPRLNYDVLPNHADLLLFGPAGSGKSSLIRTFYRALHEEQKICDDL